MKIIATDELKKKFGKNILINEKLSNYSWFNLGGPADLFFKPSSIEDILFFFEKLKHLNFPSMSMTYRSSGCGLRQEHPSNRKFGFSKRKVYFSQ